MTVTPRWPDVLSALIGGLGPVRRRRPAGRWARSSPARRRRRRSPASPSRCGPRARPSTEIEGLVEAMYEHATPLTVAGRVLDVVGTGGDRSMSVNISTMAAIVAAGAGARVVKHGNRSASSKAGAADVLEALGDPAGPPGRAGGRASATRSASPSASRRPSTPRCATPPWPAARAGCRRPRSTSSGRWPTRPSPQAQAIGCADPRMAPVMAGVFARRGVDAWVFRGDDGLDELTTTTTSRSGRSPAASVVEHTLDPREVGIPRGTAEGLRGAGRRLQRRRSYAACSPASRGRSATPWCSTPGPPWRSTPPLVPGSRTR